MAAPNNPIGVVDYDAWNRGYTPPSEHILIDKLAFHGARVVYSMATSMKGQMWIVVEGGNDLMMTIDDLLEFTEFLRARRNAKKAAKEAPQEVASNGEREPEDPCSADRLNQPSPLEGE